MKKIEVVFRGKVYRVKAEKKCTVCSEIKDIHQFYWQIREGRWLRVKSACKPCHAAKVDKYKKENPNKVKETTKKYYYGRSADKKDKYKSQRLLWRYGINTEQKKNLVDLQGGCCMICGTAFNSTKEQHIDHDHTCCGNARACDKCIRGILCNLCNTGIGYFRDNPYLLELAAQYLRGFKYANDIDRGIEEKPESTTDL